MKKRRMQRNSGNGEVRHYGDYLLNNQREIYLFDGINGDSAIETHTQIRFLDKQIQETPTRNELRDLSHELDKEIAIEDYIMRYEDECVADKIPKNKRMSPKKLRESVDVVYSKKVTKLSKKLQQVASNLTPSDHITLWINSIGGDVLHTLALIDVIDNCSCDVHTIGTGMVASAGVLLLLAGTKGCRGATKGTRFMTHASVFGAFGDPKHMTNSVQNGDEVEEVLKKLTLSRTKMNKKKFDKIHTTASYFFGVEEALKLGIIDYVV